MNITIQFHRDVLLDISNNYHDCCGILQSFLYEALIAVDGIMESPKFYHIKKPNKSVQIVFLYIYKFSCPNLNLY